MTPDELKRIQAALGLTNRQLAEQLGLCPSTIVKWRIGSHRMPKIAAIAIRSLVRGTE